MWQRINRIATVKPYSLFQEKISKQENNNFEVFCNDGSVMSDIIGSAFVHKNSGTVSSYYNNKNISSMSTELVAIIKVLEFSINNDLKKKAILTDSLSGFLAVKNGGKGNSLVKELVELAKDINGEIELHYIPGHSNIFINEAADQAAKQARQLGTEVNTPLTNGDAIM